MLTTETKKITLQDRPPNFRNTEGNLYIVRCFKCDPERGVENWACAVAAGICSFCGWSEEFEDNKNEFK